MSSPAESPGADGPQNADDQESVSISKAELQILEGLIALEEEDRGDRAKETVTIFEPPEAVAGWAAIGRWAWRNKGKLLALAGAATDLLAYETMDAGKLRTVSQEKLGALLPRESNLEELIAARDAIYRAMEEENRPTEPREE